MLRVEDIHLRRGRTPVLHGVSLSVAPGEIVALIGPNGAGKTSTLSAISGLLPVRQGRIAYDGPSGEIDIARSGPARLVAAGLAHCPEGRQIFGRLSVQENLRLGAFLRRDAEEIRRDMQAIYDLFPILGERRAGQAGALSGGEQMMLAIGRSLMARPRLLLLDEPSLGLAPRITETIFATLRDLNAARGMAMLVVEQNAMLALDVAHRAYVMAEGAIQREGAAEALRDDEAVLADYLGVGG